MIDEIGATLGGSTCGGKLPVTPARRSATVWRARAELHLGNPSTSLEILEQFGEGQPATPSWGARWVVLTRGHIFDVMGRREDALAQYQAVKDLGLSPLYSRAAEAAVEGLDEPFRLTPSMASAGR